MREINLESFELILPRKLLNLIQSHRIEQARESGFISRCGKGWPMGKWGWIALHYVLEEASTIKWESIARL
ncbi:hypothetical protein QYF36_010551 [Acer negundo]|nr:hypothetical protein QYF36_010551 [Acer negundo]